MKKALTTMTVIFLLLFTSGVEGHAQNHYYDNWFFGDSIGLNFSTGVPLSQRGSLATNEGSDAISDPLTGALLLYTDGKSVWNGNHQVMLNGTGLKGGRSSTQSALIVPMPGDTSRYYIFTADTGPYDELPHEGIHYSIVDMSGDGGLGEVTVKNVSLLAAASERLVGVRHCNDLSIWVIGYEREASEYYAWEVTDTGIVDPVRTHIPVDPARTISPAGQLKASPDGKHLFALHAFDYPYLEKSFGILMEFDNQTGTITRSVMELEGLYSASFSPNSRYLYTIVFDSLTTTFPILQYDVAPENADDILSSARSVSGVPEPSIPFTRASALQLAVDGNIYVALTPSRVGRIENPDLATAFFRDSVALFNREEVSLPPLYVRLGLSNSIDGYLIPDSTLYPLRRTVDTAICLGESIRLQPSDGPGYRWDQDPDPGCYTCREPVVSPDSTTTYTVTVAGADGACAFREAFRVEVAPLPVIETGPDTVICLGEQIRLGVNGADRYLWGDNSDLSCLDCSDPVATPSRSTTYYVTGWNAEGCGDRDSVRISIIPNPVADAGEEGTLCPGESLQLHATGGGRYLWTMPDGGPATTLSCTDCPDPIATPSTTTTYLLQVISSAGCTDVDSVTLTVQSDVMLTLSSDTAFCIGGLTELRATGADSYQWDFSVDLSCTDCSNPTATPTTTTTYYVTGTNSEGGCPARDSITVTVNQLPQISAGQDTATCADGSVVLRAEGGDEYRWDFSPWLSCLDCADPVATPPETTTFYLTGFSPEGCQARDSITVTVGPPPVIDAGRDQRICAGNSTQLKATGGIRWQWTPADGLSCTDCPDPIASPASTTLYRLTAWGPQGCAVDDSVTVVVDPVRSITLHIDRDHHSFNGEPLIVPIAIDDEIENSDIDRITLELEYDPQIMLLDQSSFQRLLDGTVLEGWSVTILNHHNGTIELELQAPPGKTLSGIGDLLRFEARMYLSDVPGTELPFRVRAESNCFSFSTAPGYVKMDSICGFNLRLIELSGGKYRPPSVYPNPATSDRVTFDFGIGLEGMTRLEVYDQRGNRVALLIDQILVPGTYRVEWMTGGVASGIYHYRLTSGPWNQSGVVGVK